MQRVLGIIALIGFMLSLAAHIAAVCGVAVAEHIPFIWLLHLGVFAVFIPLVFAMKNTMGNRPSFKQIRAAFPAWVIVVGICLFVYVAVNFLLAMGGMEGEPGLADNGKYVLSQRGKLIREISPAEFTRFKANQIRAFSGHWLLFYFMPFAYFMFYRKPK